METCEWRATPDCEDQQWVMHELALIAPAIPDSRALLGLDASTPAGPESASLPSLEQLTSQIARLRDINEELQRPIVEELRVLLRGLEGRSFGTFEANQRIT